MKYTEFLSSAKRHNHACKVLKARIDALNEQGAHDDDFRFLVLSLYYLSGYIIECSLKFKIFELSNFDLNLEVNEDECSKAGIDYKRRIKTHSFNRLQDYLASFTSDITFESEQSEVTILLQRWSPSLRYENVELEHTQIINFYEHSTQLLRRM